MLPVVTNGLRVKFLALGTVSLPSLKCRESLEVEADTADDTIPAGPPTMNDKVCFSPAFDINGQLEPRCAMEPYALELPNPEAPKCITISFDPGKQSFLLDTAYVFRLSGGISRGRRAKIQPYDP